MTWLADNNPSDAIASARLSMDSYFAGRMAIASVQRFVHDPPAARD